MDSVLYTCSLPPTALPVNQLATSCWNERIAVSSDLSVAIKAEDLSHLNWLSIKEGIEFNMAKLAFKATCFEDWPWCYSAG